jgi:hypothetical protein
MATNNVEVIGRCSEEERARWKAEDAAAQASKLWNPAPTPELTFHEYATARAITEALFGPKV